MSSGTPPYELMLDGFPPGHFRVHGFTGEEADRAKASVTSYNANAIWVPLNSKDELIKYLNTRSLDGYDYRKSQRILVQTVRIYSHGRPSIILFDMQGDDNGPEYTQFGSPDVANLDATAFAADATLSCMACRTGNTSFEERFGAGWKQVAKPEESLAQKLADGLGITVYAPIARTNYTPTWWRPDSHGTGGAPPEQDWSWGEEHLQDQLVRGGKALWNSKGAGQPSRVSQVDPKGLEEAGGGGMWVFEPAPRVPRQRGSRTPPLSRR